MNNFTQVFFSLKNKLKSNFVTTLGFALLMLISLNSFGQTPYLMSGGNYSEQFTKIANITNWPNGFNGTDCTEWKSVPVNTSGTVGDGVKISTSSATFATGSSGAVQRGAANIVLLSTGTANSCGIDLLLNFTGRIAGTVSFDLATVFNSTGNRNSIIKLFYSTNGTTFTELTGTNLPFTATNNVAASASVVNIALPAAFNNSATAVLRFYEYSTNTGSGSQPKISIDNVSVTSTSSGCTAPTTAASNFDFTGTTQTQMPVSFTAGSGAGRVVIMNSSNTFTAPIAGSNPSANTVYGGGQQVVYNGTGNSFTVTGLNPDTTYYYSIYEYCDTERNYGSAFAGSNATLAYTVSSCKLQAPTTLTTNQGTPVTVNAIVLASGLTDAAGQGAGVSSWIGYSSADTNPNTAGWTWVAASYLGDSTTYDEYQASIGGALASGTYYIASRFQIGSGAYTYGGVTDIWNNDSGTLTVNAVIPVVTGASLNGNVGTPFTYNIMATNAPTSYAVSSGTLPNGLTLNTTTGQISGTPTTAGSFSVDVTATNVGGTSTPATLSFTIGLSNQTITFGVLSSVTYGVAPYTLTATASSTLPVSFASSNTAVATISGTTITIVGAGTTTITASQAGDSNYNPATNVVRALTVNQKALTITGVTADNKVQDGTTAATLSGTPTLVGVEAVDNGNVTVTGTPTATFATAAPGTAIAVTVTGYTLGGTAAGNYTVSQPTGLTANITGLAAPVANAATGVLQTTFDANWNAVSGATSYALDVSNYLAFGADAPTTMNEGFETGMPTSGYSSGAYTLGSGSWTFVNILRTPTPNINSGTYGCQLQGGTSASIKSPSLNNVGVVTFYAKRGTTATSVIVKKVVLGVTTTLQTIPLTTTMTQYSVSVNDNSSGVEIIIQNGAAVAYVDDLVINHYAFAPSFVGGYNNLNVGNVTTYPVTVPTPETTYYYRVRAVNGVAQSANSNPITVTTKPVSVTWNGTAWSNTTGPDADIEAAISGAYNTGTNSGFTAKKVTVTSTPAGSLTIAAGTNVTVVNEVVNQLTETAFVVKSDGNLIQTNDVTNTGTITVERLSAPIARLDYTLWSSPVDGQQLQAFSPGTVSTRFYSFNPTLTPLGGSAGQGAFETITSTNPFVEGNGYLIRASNWQSTSPTPWLGTFKGVPNNGNVSVTTTSGSWYAVGNPYPSSIDADEFITANSLTEPLYFWRKTNGDAGTAYATYTFAGGTGTEPNASGTIMTPDGIIAVGQGFLTQAASTSLVFTNALRNGDYGAQFFKSSSLNKSRVWLNLSNNDGFLNQALIAYMPTATTGIDAAIDGKFLETTIATQLSSIINGQEFAVQGRPAFTASDIVALGFKTQTEGNYTIAIDHVDGLFANGQEVFLKDNLTNTVHNLTNAPYNFVATAGTANTRFEIVYESTLATQNSVLNENMVTIYKQNQNLVVNTGAVEMKNVKVYDIQGRLLVEQKDVNAATAKLAISSTNQVLIVKVTSKEGTTVTKKVVF